MKLSEITQAILAGEDARADAEALRRRIRGDGSKGSDAREAAIDGAIAKINEAMVPIRSLIGRLLWDPAPEEQDRALRSISKRLGYERKQLKKMRG